MADRRQRIHELLLALLARQTDLELLEGHGAGLAGAPLNADPGSWLERNRRVMQRYQALVRTAVTLETLTEQELGGDGLAEGR
ncbi:MAG: hypothetical protein VKI42_01500 [Synechococcaceae cyanobacterium]|nr:hypothetical protein [Synechococcaceae cyanobacterium]